MPDLKEQLSSYIDSLAAPVSRQEVVRERPKRFRATAAVFAGAAVVLIPALALVGLWLFTTDSDGVADTATTLPATSTIPADQTPTTGAIVETTALPLLEVAELTPSQVSASAALNEAYAESNLIDGDLETTWQAGHDLELILEFRWNEPVEIRYLEVYNIADEIDFLRNFRMKGYTITIDDIPGIEIRNSALDQLSGPQRIDVASIATRVLTLEITSSYAGEAVAGEAPFYELALAEVRFWGSTSP